MAIRKVAQLGNPVLRKKAEPVAVEDIDTEEIQNLIYDMIDTKEEYSGAGLAAPQVHESLQIIVVGVNSSERYPDSGESPETVLINPKIIAFSQEMDEDWEGCLSLTDLWGKVKRATAITVTGYDRDGNGVEIKAEGFVARAFQHEIDHLHGKLFIDRMSEINTLSFGPEFRRYGAMIEEEPV